MTSDEAVSRDIAAGEALHRASVNDRYGRAAVFAAGICVVGTLALLVGLLGWWALLAAPAYLAATGLAAMLARGRLQALLAVALATACMGLLVAAFKLLGPG